MAAARKKNKVREVWVVKDTVEGDYRFFAKKPRVVEEEVEREVYNYKTGGYDSVKETETDFRGRSLGVVCFDDTDSYLSFLKRLPADVPVRVRLG